MGEAVVDYILGDEPGWGDLHHEPDKLMVRLACEVHPELTFCGAGGRQAWEDQDDVRRAAAALLQGSGLTSFKVFPASLIAVHEFAPPMYYSERWATVLNNVPVILDGLEKLAIALENTQPVRESGGGTQRYCVNCGAGMPPDAKFCTICGSPRWLVLYGP